MAHRVLILDDHPVFRFGLRRILEADARIACVGEAGDPAGALAVLDGTGVDVVTVDLALEGASGLAFLRVLSERWPSVRALVLTMSDESVYGEPSLRAGARGFLGKGVSGEAVRDAVCRVAAGELVASAALRARLRSAAAAPGAGLALAQEVLTSREFEIFRLVGRGLDPVTLGEVLGVSAGELVSRRSSIVRKLGLDDDAALLDAALAAFAGDVAH